MAKGIKGITVEINGNTAPLDKALKSVNSTAKSLQSELNAVEKGLKLDPNNITLTAQKSQILKEEIAATKEKLDALKAAQAQVKGEPEKKISFSELAVRANPLRGAVKPGTEPGLEATAYFGPATGATANGVHGVILEIDPETLQVLIKKYVVVHDCGKVVNPMIVEGQMHGGVLQGIGNA